MSTVRSTDTDDTDKTPRKRAPRKTQGKKASSGSQPTTAGQQDQGEDRVAQLRAMLIAEGIDPDPVLARSTPGHTPEPDPIEGEIVAETTATVDETPDHPIPGVTIDGIREMIVNARQHPETADTIIEGIRGLIKANGRDPDVVIAEAMGTAPDGTQRTNPNGLLNAIVDFRGRRIEVTAPEIEQVMVIRRMQSLFANAAKMETITADEAVRLMDRALKAVCSVIVDPADVEYLEDLLLTRQARIEDTLPLLNRSLLALEDANVAGGNRAERRSAARSTGRAGSASLVTATE